MKYLWLAILLLPGALAVAAAGTADRFVGKLSLSSGHTVLVYEGEFEARSVGSYSVLLYAPAPPEERTTFFLSGVVTPRDGVIENVRLSDLDGDHAEELIVVSRSVGTGGYLSAEAYRIVNERICIFRSVRDLPPDADCEAALRQSGENNERRCGGAVMP